MYLWGIRAAAVNGMKLGAAVCGGLSLLPAVAWAQDDNVITGSELAISAEDILGRLDLDVPDSPAFAILGIAPQNVVNPDTPAELATALFVGDDQAGNSQEGMAVEFRPYLLALGSEITVADYLHNQWLSRAAVSLSRSKGTDADDRAERQALGLSFTPIDERDPLTSSRVDQCLSEGIDKAGPAEERLREEVRIANRAKVAAEEANDAEAAEVARAQEIAALEALNQWVSGERKDFIEEHTDTCLNTFRTESINARQLQLGVAWHDSRVEGIDESGAALWVSYAIPAMKGSLTMHARYSENLLVADPDIQGQYNVKDESLVALRFRRGDDKRAVLVEAAYIDQQDNSGSLDDRYGTALIGAEFRVVESLWIQVALGESFGASQDTGMALSSQFRWAASKTRLWKGTGD
jgi:hypothetical protein